MRHRSAASGRAATASTKEGWKVMTTVSGNPGIGRVASSGFNTASGAGS